MKTKRKEVEFRSSRAGHEPFLFFLDQIDWHWWSYRRCERFLAEGDEFLASAEPQILSGSHALGYSSWPHPSAFLLDSMIAKSGRIAVPIESSLVPAGPVEEEAEARYLTAVESSLGESRGRFARFGRREASPEFRLSKTAFLAPVIEGGALARWSASSEWLGWSSANIDDVALDLADLLARDAARRGSRVRDVTVILDALSRPWCRLAWEWARGAGSAVVLGSAEHGAEITAWAQPTVIYGSASELDNLEQFMTSLKPRTRE